MLKFYKIHKLQKVQCIFIFIMQNRFPVRSHVVIKSFILCYGAMLLLFFIIVNSVEHSKIFYIFSYLLHFIYQHSTITSTYKSEVGFRIITV